MTLTQGWVTINYVKQLDKPMAKTNALNIIHEQSKRLRSVCAELAQLRDAFEMTGNMNLADDLDRMAVSIHKAQDEITKGYHKEVREQCDAMNKALGDTIGALAKS